MRTVRFVLQLAALAVAVGLLLPELRPPAAGDPAGAPELTLADARAFYASQPRYLQPVPYTPTPAGLTDLRAESCAACHREIYEEWQVSTHARAWLDDAQFQGELHKGTATPGQDYSWMCVNCHTPLENQLPRLVAALEDGDLTRPRYVDNPHYDSQLQLEAITCATCHVKDGVILGPYGNRGAPHPVERAPELLSSQVCLQCHQASAVFEEIPLGCFFNTGTEVAEGPRAGQTCQSCHMPEVERPLTHLGTPVRRTRRHWFGGSLIPKRPQDEADLAPLREVYPDGVSLTWGELPPAATPGQPLRLTFVATNDEAAHRMPTGDPERFILLTAEVTDASGQVLARRQERIGSIYNWDPIELVSDNRLAPGERRPFSLDVDALPAEVQGPLTLSLTASKWRINAENLAYHQLEGKTVPGRVYFRQRRSLPLRD